MIVCDEAHKIKSLDGTRASCVLGLSEHASSRVVLTGTPCPNGPEDIIFLSFYIQKGMFLNLGLLLYLVLINHLILINLNN